jgi:hypothetical protein
MGLFSKTPQVPNTVSDDQMRDLSRRAAKHAPPLLSREATQRRLASNAQQANADSN